MGDANRNHQNGRGPDRQSAGDQVPQADPVKKGASDKGRGQGADGDPCYEQAGLERCEADNELETLRGGELYAP